MSTRRVLSRFATIVVAIALLGAIVASPAGAALRHIDGTVVSKNAREHSFRLSTQSGTLVIRVDSTTVFQRLSGFGALHKGLAIEVDAKKTAEGLLAERVETRGGGGEGGGGGHGDGPNHT